MNQTWRITALVFLMTFSAMCAHAGFWALPIEAELDLADRVVVGRIVRIAEHKTKYDGDMRTGLATISVDETLKGPAEKTIVIRIVTRMTAGPGHTMQSPPRVYARGDSGIWVIMRDGTPSHGYGLLDLRRLPEIKAHLAGLGRRTWSPASGGIRIWAGAAGSVDEDYMGRQRVMVAVRNVGERPVHLPLSFYDGIVRAVARHEGGTPYELRGIGDRSGRRDDMVCVPLEPGRTRYMHWDGADYGAFLFPPDAPPGSYTLRATLSNDRTEGVTRGNKKRRVKAWTGTVVSEPSSVRLKAKPPGKGDGGETGR
jgi:hypothetical protein